MQTGPSPATLGHDEGHGRPGNGLPEFDEGGTLLGTGDGKDEGIGEGQFAVPPPVIVTMLVEHTVPDPVGDAVTGSGMVETEAPGIGMGPPPPGMLFPLLLLLVGQMPKHWQRKPVNKIVAIARNRITPPEKLF